MEFHKRIHRVQAFGVFIVAQRFDNVTGNAELFGDLAVSFFIRRSHDEYFDIAELIWVDSFMNAN